MERRLAAILIADVVNYSLLMNSDEGATYKAWREARNEVIDPRVSQFRGRIVKFTGDGFLAEFPTALAAVECAVDVQSEMVERHTQVSGGRLFQFRIGINLGDIIVDDEDIHGDGVNIAARLESIAEPGGVCISADVFRQVNNKPGFHFVDLGEHTVKNIPVPLHVFRVSRGEANVLTPFIPAKQDIQQTDHSRLNDVLDTISTPVHANVGLVVGRSEERTMLEQSFTDACAQRGNITLIRGEPGIGKSCLAWSFSEQAQKAGARVVFGQCHETLGSPPFWPWLQVLKMLHGSGGAKIASSARIFESMAETSDNGPSTFAGSVGSEQFLLFNRIANFLAETAETQTLLIILDDLHWADRSSLLLLTHLCRKLAEQPIMIIGTYREMEVTRKHPLFESLGDMGREIKLRRIGLKGLSKDDVSGFLQQRIDLTLSAELVQTLYDKTEGNPLFVAEVTDLLQQKKSHLQRGQFSLEIPDGIQEAIGQRLNLLSEDCNELLSMAAVIGRNFSIRILDELLPDTDQFHTLQILEEATSRGILRESDSTVGEFQFSHVLMRDILYKELSLARKIILHGKVANILVELENKGAQQSLGEIARHYYQALQSGQSEKALDYAVRAGRHAYALAAFDEALDYYELALDVISVDERGRESIKSQTLIDVVKCLHAQGSGNRTIIAALDRCLTEARQHGQHDIFIEAACRKIYQARDPKMIPAALKVVDEALEHIAEDDFVARANVLAHRSMAFSFNSRRREAEHDAYLAVELAAKSGSPSAHCNALCMALLVLRGRPEKLSERIQLGEQALAIALSIGDVYMCKDPLEWLILSYQEAGDMTRVRRLITTLDQSVESAYRFKAHYCVAGASACLALYNGNWQQAETLIEEAIQIGSGSLDGGADGVYGAQMFLLNRELGRLPMIHSALSRMVGDHTPMWKPGLLATYTDLGMLEKAKPLFDDLIADDFNIIAEDELLLTCLVYLTEACVALDSADKAANLYRRLLPYSGQMVSHPTAVCYGPADMYLGMLASLMNELDEACTLFIKAAELVQKSGQNMWLTHINFRHAQVLQRHNYHGGKSVFQSLIEQAREAAQPLGMINILAKITALEEKSVTSQSDNLSGLTHRELEVLKLISEGKSNKVIAAEINRSLATVASHVRAILHKTHTANRTEAAGFARVHNL